MRCPCAFRPRRLAQTGVAETYGRGSKFEVLLEVIFVAGVIYDELGQRLKGSKISFRETVVEFDLEHDDNSAWQVQDFG